MLDSAVLFDSPLVRILDLRCDAPASAAGPEERDRVTQVVVPRRGVFKVHRGADAVIADANTALVFGAGDRYRVSHPVAGGDECTVLVFPRELVQEALGGERSRAATLGSDTQLATRLLTAAAGNEVLDRLEIEEAAIRLLGALARDIQVPDAAAARRPGEPQRRAVEEVRTLLAARPSTGWSLDAVARAVHCSPYHLARRFRAATGESIWRYLLRLRLALALQRMAEGETNLGLLALELGFAHHSHFSARFRSVFGTTPSAARAALTNRGVHELSTILTAGDRQRP